MYRAEAQSRVAAPPFWEALMRRHLLFILATCIGMLVFASGAFAADTLTLCVKKDGTIRAATTCKSGETPFVAVSKARVDALEARVNKLESLLAGVTRETVNTYDTLRFTSMNLQVVNGSNYTDSPDGVPAGSDGVPTTTSANGLGNLFIGYNTNGNYGPVIKTGSHNLVVGDGHSYTKTSGIVTGNGNSLTGFGSFASGKQNVASSGWSFVAGGFLNTASGFASFASGQESVASAVNSFVGGGRGGKATNNNAFVGGGYYNTASGYAAFVGGGSFNTAGPGSCANIFGTFFPTGCP
jgi:hypothetical protein